MVVQQCNRPLWCYSSVAFEFMLNVDLKIANRKKDRVLVTAPKND